MNFIKRISSRLITLFTLSFLYPLIYKINSTKAVEDDKVIFLSIRNSQIGNNFRLIYDALDKNTDFKLVNHCLMSGSCSKSEYIKRCSAYIKDLATAKYLFQDEAAHITGKINIRPETFVTQLWHGCGAFKKFGYSTAASSFGASAKTMDRFPPNKNYSLVTVSSEDVIPHFEQAMGYEHKKGTVKATGVSRTDVFFDKDYINKAYRKLYSVFPEAKNKKVILYAPTFRGNVENATSPDCLDICELCSKLSDEYVLILKYHHVVKKSPFIPENIKNDFAVDLTDKMDINELLCVSDICISDYSSLVFEYSLLERPMIFYAYDLEEYFDNRGFYYNFSELAPGPILKTTEEITDYILNIGDNYKINTIKKFRNKFMSACDGKSTQRIIAEVFGEEYNKHKTGT